jgi:hypothetical protein
MIWRPRFGRCNIKTMDSHIVDDLLAEEEQNRLAADENVRPEQLLEAGDFFLRLAHGIRIYGKILDVGEFYLDGRTVDALDEDEREEYDEEVAQYKQPHMRFYRFTKCYSQACPSGELGDIHLSTVTRKLTAGEFEAAKKTSWR